MITEPITNPVYDLTARASTLAGVSHHRVFSTCRTPVVCRIRWAVWIVFRDAGWSLHEIRRAADKRDHGTIIHGLREGRKLAITDKRYAKFIARLRTLRTESILWP